MMLKVGDLVIERTGTVLWADLGRVLVKWAGDPEPRVHFLSDIYPATISLPETCGPADEAEFEEVETFAMPELLTPSPGWREKRGLR